MGHVLGVRNEQGPRRSRAPPLLLGVGPLPQMPERARLFRRPKVTRGLDLANRDADGMSRAAGPAQPVLRLLRGFLRREEDHRAPDFVTPHPVTTDEARHPERRGIPFAQEIPACSKSSIVPRRPSRTGFPPRRVPRRDARGVSPTTRNPPTPRDTNAVSSDQPRLVQGSDPLQAGPPRFGAEGKLQLDRGRGIWQTVSI